MDDQATTTAEERHASWLELFFDLVAVAGIGQFAHLLHGSPSLPDVGMYLLLYLAFWTMWASYTIYGNVHGDRAFIPVMLAAMFGIAVMVAAVSGVQGDRANAFALAYVLVRLLAVRLWRPGQVLVDWPMVQVGAGHLPWIVSLWIDTPAKYWLWAAGIALDLIALLAVSDDQMVRTTRERMDRFLARFGKISERRGRPLPRLEVVRLDVGHLAERLGLYVIIVLGEGVILLVAGASGVQWDAALGVTAVSGFLLIAGLWVLSVRYGFAGVPHLAPGVLPGRVAMILHCVTTAAIATTVAGIGAAAAHPHHHLPATTSWLLTGSMAAYFAITAVVAAVTKAPVRWLLTAPIPGVLVAAAIGAAAPHLPVSVTVSLLLIPTYWQVLRLKPVEIRTGRSSNGSESPLA